MTHAYAVQRRPISRAHPRLFGSLERLKQLAAERPEAFRRMSAFAHEKAPAKYNMIEHDRVFCVALTAAIEGDAGLAAEARQLAMMYVEGDIRVGHETYGHDMARVAVCYDLCHAAFSADDKSKLFTYMDKTIDANV
ncbi:MAG TPA: hypothetical protein VL860_15205, partial [Planctomycetota bacterium]|nr:hypothetical protein [Planctomycetota bacterium]